MRKLIASIMVAAAMLLCLPAMALADTLVESDVEVHHIADESDLNWYVDSGEAYQVVQFTETEAQYVTVTMEKWGSIVIDVLRAEETEGIWHNTSAQLYNTLEGAKAKDENDLIDPQDDSGSGANEPWKTIYYDLQPGTYYVVLNGVFPTNNRENVRVLTYYSVSDFTYHEGDAWIVGDNSRAVNMTFTPEHTGPYRFGRNVYVCSDKGKLVSTKKYGTSACYGLKKDTTYKVHFMSALEVYELDEYADLDNPIPWPQSYGAIHYEPGNAQAATPKAAKKLPALNPTKPPKGMSEPDLYGYVTSIYGYSVIGDTSDCYVKFEMPKKAVLKLENKSYDVMNYFDGKSYMQILDSAFNPISEPEIGYEVEYGLKAGTYYLKMTKNKKAASGTYEWAVSTSVPKPGKTILKEAKPGKGSLKLVWTKCKKASGYQVKYSNNEKFKNAKTVMIKGAKNVTTVIKNLKSKTTCLAKVRSYKVVNGVKFFGEWTPRRKVVIG